jgi:alkylated DNA repair dioxygenase AlkB
MSALPDGFVYAPEMIMPEEEAALIERIRALDFGSFQMHGVTAKRRIAHFGWRYSFDSRGIAPAGPMPEAFAEIRARVAGLAGIEAEGFAETLVTEYIPGAGIGWHRDAPAFGIVAGVSLAGLCRMRFQYGKGAERRTAVVELEPRSLYLLTGEARTKWQHMIPPAKTLRYSITFRTLRNECA